ncbi:hypothetical protein [Rhodovulum visakhapatnamense]|uniref:Uncharacterized protein n=1 Tax=Rhodovulum visakhapatnamense TaxID=364297 RepID=A0ABS1RM27_9RHOB|nr:hypothetical protein [Rhodovulum visakhapatnamense]MBL3571906.1 hypothetical protein [Rhodovulum visakhapatnamense]MBL3579942.1 hypothetical protein [Rhodovulum visakhapatnamense]
MQGATSPIAPSLRARPGMLDEGVDIGGVLKNYDRTNYDVHRSYCHPEMVAEAEASVVQ